MTTCSACSPHAQRLNPQATRDDAVLRRLRQAAEAAFVPVAEAFTPTAPLVLHDSPSHPIDVGIAEAPLNHGTLLSLSSVWSMESLVSQRTMKLATFAPWLFVLLWSTGFIGARFGLPYIEPFTFLSIRFAVVASLLAGLALALRAPWPRDRVIGVTTVCMYRQL